MHTIKYSYCQRALLRIGFCLLLVCSANVASAQATISLSTPQTDGLIIRFAINYGGSLTGNQRVVPVISVSGISFSEIRRFRSLPNYQCTGLNGVTHFGGDSTNYLVCMGGAITLELKVKNPDASKNITISITSVTTQNFSGSTTIDQPLSTLNFTVNPVEVIRIRSKVFLEGALQ